MSDKDSSDNFSGNAGDRTRIDLGDDLLENTATIQSPHFPKNTPPPEAIAPGTKPRERYAQSEDPQELLENAKILMSENLTEEAKQTLRRVLILDPQSRAARSLLDDIHEVEIKQILGQLPSDRRPKRTWRTATAGGLIEIPTSPLSSQEVMEALEKDLAEGPLSVLAEREFESAYALAVETELAGAMPRDRVDVGIAFLEMGFYSVAVKVFETATSDPEFSTAALTLQATAFIYSKKPFDAVLCLEAGLSDPDLDASQKAELSYLMARAHEDLGKRELACQWYATSLQSLPGYRDAAERLLRLES